MEDKGKQRLTICLGLPRGVCVIFASGRVANTLPVTTINVLKFEREGLEMGGMEWDPGVIIREHQARALS